MQALKLRKEVVDGKIVLNVPKDFGTIVEIIILGCLDDELEFWNEDEIKGLGKTKGFRRDFNTASFTEARS